MKKLLLIVFAFAMLLSLAGCTSKVENSDAADGKAVELEAEKDFPLTANLDKQEYKPGEEITVTFSREDWYLDVNAWAGIIPSEIEHNDETLADEYDIDYRYLYDLVDDKAVFTAPDAGKYDMRVFTSDDEGAAEILYIPFTVAG